MSIVEVNQPPRVAPERRAPMRNLPCGAPIPDSVHAVSVSMPKLADLIAYEQGDPDAFKRIPTGYPRFHTHPYNSAIAAFLKRRFGLREEVLIFPSRRAAVAACEFAGIGQPELVEYRDLTALSMEHNEAEIEKIRRFRQHTGTHVSSRRAEDFLIAEGQLDRRYPEEYFDGDGEAQIKQILNRAYETGNAHSVVLANSGMNAFYALYRSLSELQHRRGRYIWIQFGWLFMDTMHVLAKITSTEVPNCVIYDVAHLDELEAMLADQGGHVAGIVTETPSNPLLRTPDVERLRRLASEYDCALIIDDTLGTPYNVRILEYADAAIESLTKYANGAADLMMGAIVLNSRSPYYEHLEAGMPAEVEPPYAREVDRLGRAISDYGERMRRVNANTMALVDYLKTRPAIDRVYWAYQEDSKANYEKIHRAPGSPGGIITLDLNRPLDTIYDRTSFAKGPSLGANFTLVGPYLYHAHYELVSSQRGREFLRSKGLNPELFRISVGVEDIDEIIREFSEVL